MKNVCLYICILLSLLGFAQDPNNHWQMGSLDFDFSTDPVQINTIGQGNPEYNGGATISDANGNLLFYFNEGNNELRDRNHDLIETVLYQGGGLPMGKSSIILPYPGNINKFYVFWGYSEQILCCPVHSFYMYSIVDFTNNPLGEAIDFNSQVGSYDNTKAKMLRDNNGVEIDNDGNQRAIAYSENAAGTGYWVIVEFEGKIFSFSVTQSGVSSVPVASYAPTVYQGDNNMMRIAPDYSNPSITKLYTSSTGNYVNSFDFNKSTGMLSNYQQISLGSYSENGFELSPDNSKMYVISSVGTIIVKDLTSLSTAPRVLYQYANPSLQASGSFLQKDKHGNVLVGGNTSYIHKVQNPNSFQNSSVQTNYVYLNGETIDAFPQLQPSTLFVPSCIDDITLSTIETNASYSYEVDNTITTNNNYSVSSGKNITFKAGNAVYLKANTHLRAGSVVVVKIEECELISLKPAKLTSKMYDDDDLSDNEYLKSFVMYPNPSNSVSTIKLDNGVITRLTVTSIEGVTMYNGSPLQSSFDLDISNYRQGIYIVTVETQKGEIFTEKLMKN
ncbi:T9SS type A sorting domain-containing protein [Flavobacterium alkalisoli]|uniref:T9SS type A sorting domain-containing protein n=1 Tax=Flavobacterium alkalisoli TaxID=2602769 RepID=A0A5B9FWD5_9FLAO|nr:T9SS type A sorting domain-containing protein [Flavobacterium alkalisoli]QEE51294.1 T9SS type A sorting domain-containing protein [Flavobacterium alkalisoli]